MRRAMVVVIVTATAALATANSALSENENLLQKALSSADENLLQKALSTSEEPQFQLVGADRPPKQITKQKRFKPDSYASGNRLVQIANIEQHIWGGPSVVGRLSCESGLNSSASNGTYHGAGQIGPWWWYAYPQTPRRVRYSTVKFRKLPVYRRWLNLETGEVTRKLYRQRRQRVKVVWTGWLPRGADQFHAWANVRVTHRAASGDGPSTGWSCGL